MADMQGAIEKRISVRDLVEFTLRSGSIDSRVSAGVKLAEGSRLHRLLQKSAGADFTPEVYLTIQDVSGAVRFTVSGRADGVLRRENETVVIEEIKTTMKRVELISEDDYPVHWAQAMCYAHIWCVTNGDARADVRLTYYQADTGKMSKFLRHFTASELADFFADLLAKYVPFAVFEHEWAITRTRSISSLAFPFEAFRDGQKRLTGAVYRAAAEGFCLYVSAPTGIGKTISTLYPAVKALGEGICERVFYLTAKTVTRAVAIDAVSKMAKTGLRAKSVVITAKDKICFLDERVCTPARCEYANGHYDRVNAAILDALETYDLMTHEEITAVSRKHRVCPFETSLDLALWADIILCDYNYAFDPKVYLKRFFRDGGGEYVFLTDEAHNLVDRAREMFSCELEKRVFAAARKTVDKKYRKLRSALKKINDIMLETLRDMDEYETRVSADRPRGLDAPLDAFIVETGGYLAENADTPQAFIDAYFMALTYRLISELYADSHKTLTTARGGGLTIKLFCADPSELLCDCLTRARASVLFSATLSPIGYFASVLGGSEDTSRTLTLPSPFPPENLRTLIAGNVSTRYRHRGRSYGEIARYIYAAAQCQTGNYIAFFPSYKYLDDVYAAFCDEYPEVRTIRQEGDMDEARRSEFLARFEHGAADTLVAFCVLGGVFSEGIDLTGDRLIGAIIVGVGLPQINTETDIVRSYYDEINGAGYDFAYKFPGINKVLQAAGRVIRSGADRGVVLLIDDRYTGADYDRLLPAHWVNRVTVGSPEDVTRELRAFWDEPRIDIGRD